MSRVVNKKRIRLHQRSLEISTPIKKEKAGWDTEDDMIPEGGQREPPSPNRWWGITPTSIKDEPVQDHEDQFLQTPCVPPDAIRDLLDEVETSYRDFCLDLHLLTSHDPGLQIWYDKFSLLRQDTYIGFNNPVLRFLISTADGASIRSSSSARDFQRIWCSVIEGIVINRLKLDNHTGCPREHKYEAASLIRDSKRVVAGIEGTSFNGQPSKGKPDISRGIRKRKRVTSSSQRRRAREEIIMEHGRKLADERDEEILLLKTENRKLKESVGKFKSIANQLRVLVTEIPQ